MRRYAFRLVTTVSLLAFVCGIRADEERGFEPLFDGKTLTGWRGYRQDDIPTSWIIEDGSIRGSGEGPDLLTEGTYGDFELRFEWKLREGGNSGVIYRVTEDADESFHTGPEYQLLDDSHYADQIGPTNSTGALYGLYGESEKTLQPVGEFNRSRIIVQDNRIQHWLNGKKLVDCEIDSEDWIKKSAASKFHNWKRFAMNKTGHVVLQAHDTPIWFRELRVKKLDSKDGADE